MFMQNMASYLGEQRTKLGESLEALVERINEIAVEVSGAPIVTSTGSGSFKIREPRLFTGKATDLEPFLAEIELVIQLQPGLVNAPSRTKAKFLLNHCSQDGVVGSWIKASRASVPNWDADYEALKKALISQFLDLNLESKMIEKLLNLRQTGRTQMYANQFVDYQQYVSWSEKYAI